MNLKKLVLLPIFLLLAACTTDQVLQNINLGIDVGTQVLSIISQTEGGTSVSADETAGLNLATNVLTEAKKDLSDGEGWYNQWKTATGDQKTTLSQKIESMVSTAQDNLATMLADAHVKNSSLASHISDAVAIMNAGLTLLVNEVNPGKVSLAKASRLPTIPGAKSAKDLKNTWNDHVQKDFPHNKV